MHATLFKIFSFFFSILSYFVFAANTMIANEDVHYSIPSEFNVNERWLSWTTTFDIETKQFKLGTVHRKFFSLTTEYEYYDIFDKLQARARLHFFSLGAVFTIKDAEDNYIGKVNEKIFRFFPTFEIISPSEEVLGIAKLNFWETKYTVRDPITNEVMATMTRPFFRLKDNWTVKILNRDLFVSKKIDPRLFITVMAFQTDMNYWQAAQISLAYSPSKSVKAGFDKEAMNAWKNKQYIGLRSELHNRRKKFENINPSEEDFNKVEEITEDYLTSIEGRFDEGAEAYPDHLVRGCSALMEMLDSEALTPKEKSALLLMIDSKL